MTANAHETQLRADRPTVQPVSLDDTRLIPITLSQLWRSTRTALPRDPRHPSDAPGGAWVGKREIARRFDVCARTIDHWLSRGMPHFKNRAPGWCASGLPTAKNGTAGSLASMGPQGGDGCSA